jgi:hypothetical protein
MAAVDTGMVTAMMTVAMATATAMDTDTATERTEWHLAGRSSKR